MNLRVLKPAHVRLRPSRNAAAERYATEPPFSLAYDGQASAGLLSQCMDKHVWVAWQYDRPEEGGGLAQAFRRVDSPYEMARFRLRGLDASARYSVSDLDKPESPHQFSGQDLMERGLPITLPELRSSGLLIYRRLNERN